MPDELHPLEALLRECIVVLDGAMGTMIQRHKLSEVDYRGERFRDWKGKDLKGSLELLNLTRPQVVEETHAAYLNAGADVVETNTFSAWWTMLIFASSFTKLTLKPLRSHVAPRIASRMKPDSNDLSAVQWDLF